MCLLSPPSRLFSRALAAVSSFHRRETRLFQRSLIPDPQDGKFLRVVIAATQQGGRGRGAEGAPAAESSNRTPAEVLTGSCPRWLDEGKPPWDIPLS